MKQFSKNGLAVMLTLVLVTAVLATACQNPFSRPVPAAMDLSFEIVLGSKAARSLSAPEDFAGKRLTIRLHAADAAGKPGPELSSFTTLLQEPSATSATITVPVTFNSVPTRMDLILSGTLADTDPANTVYYTASSGVFQASWTAAAEVDLPFAKTTFPPDAKAFTSFGFRKSLNASLGQDYVATISGTLVTGTTISLVLPVGTDPVILETLIPTFAHTGKAVVTGGSSRISSVSSQNFSNPAGVEYSVAAVDASTRTYTVRVTISGYDPVLAVSFDPNGGTGTMANQTILTGESALLATNSFTRTGYTFAGWNTLADGSGTPYVPVGATYTMGTTSEPLYAQWTANPYTVTFNPAGGTASQGTLGVTYDEPYGPMATATRPGYDFMGWWTAPGGTGTQVKDTDTYSVAGNQDLYAYWVNAMYNVTLVVSGGSAVTPNPYPVFYDLPYGSFPETTLAGYSFAGWWTGVGGTGTQVLSTDLYALTTDQTLYAKWAANENTITFIANEGIGFMVNQMAFTDQLVSLDLNKYTRDGYVFSGWNTLADGSGTPYADGASLTMGPGDLVLYAQWPPAQLAVTINLANPLDPAITFSGTLAILARSGAGYPSMMTVTADPGFVDYIWLLNGETIDPAMTATGNQVVIYAGIAGSELYYGAHNLTLLVTDAEVVEHSIAFSFQVQE